MIDYKVVITPTRKICLLYLSFLRIVKFSFLIIFLASCSHVNKDGKNIENAIVLNELCGQQPSEICQLKYKNLGMAQKIRDKLYRSKLLLLTAESLTAGNFAGVFGEIAWSGGALAGGIVSYATSVKNAELNVTFKDDHLVMSKKTALEMILGLEEKAKIINKFQRENGKESLAKVFVALTGATTTWKGETPHVFIAIKVLNKNPVVKKMDLNKGLNGTSIERIFNIEKSISLALKMLDLQLSE